MPSAFDKAFAVVVGSEGGYSDNPADPGGETNWGVSKRSYPDLDIKALTQAEAKEIYRRDFWDKIQGDKLHPSLALVVFDCAINNGVSRASKLLQLAVGVTQDGIIGPATITASEQKPTAAVIIEFMAQRTRFMFSLPSAATFGLGWARRLAALPFAAMALEPQPDAPPPPAHSQDDIVNAVEVALRRILEDHALVQAIAQRPSP